MDASHRSPFLHTSGELLTMQDPPPLGVLGLTGAQKQAVVGPPAPEIQLGHHGVVRHQSPKASKGRGAGGVIDLGRGLLF